MSLTLTRRQVALVAVAPALTLPTACTAKPRSRLVAGDLPPNYSSTDDTVVRRRVLATFPIGGPEAGLESYLAQEGFDVRRITNVGATGDQVYGEAKLSWGGVFTGRRVRIMWRATRDGILFEVGTLVEMTGLLGALGQL
ncbi:hypothetical protein [Phenylobacterium sp.]|jgi:hypothetical protein|uniref:hypothetical protein n=1 Tax=Phenylobacterium sp. TaxID=1871053 RepID=UPI002F956724